MNESHNLERQTQRLNQEFNIFPLGDSAATMDFGNTINKSLNSRVRNIGHWLRQHSLQGFKNVIEGYSSVSILYDPVILRRNYLFESTAFDFIRKKLEEAWKETIHDPIFEDGPLTRIPVCYDEEFGIDLNFIASEKHLSKEEIIRIHQSKSYHVYMIGFLPGFSYMADVDERLVIPRKKVPVTVSPGSVGIAGSQTGVYPISCPGGWQIIGRTPMALFDPSSENPVKLQAGDQVQFYSISRSEFEAASQ